MQEKFQVKESLPALEESTSCTDLSLYPELTCEEAAALPARKREGKRRQLLETERQEESHPPEPEEVGPDLVAELSLVQQHALSLSELGRLPRNRVARVRPLEL